MGEAQSTSQCSASVSNNSPIIVGVTVGGIITLLIISAVARRMLKKRCKTQKAATSHSVLPIPIPPPTNPAVSAPPMHFDNRTTHITGMADKWHNAHCGEA